MFSRFKRIREEFGTRLFLRTLFLLVALVGIGVIAYFGADSLWPAVVAVVGLGLGWLLRKLIVDSFERLAAVLPVALFIYGVVLFAGEKLFGLSAAGQLLVIATVTVIVFEIQFWSLSDPSIINLEKPEDD
ncbi:MAG: hypothetical protein ABL984_17860 [Pyrinomonadaceae bacterium]